MIEGLKENRNNFIDVNLFRIALIESINANYSIDKPIKKIYFLRKFSKKL